MAQLADRNGGASAEMVHAEQAASLDALLRERDALGAEIGRLKAAGQDVSHLIARSKSLSLQIKSLRSASALGKSAVPRESSISCELLDTTEQFEGLRHDWDDLIGRCGSPVTPFMRWEWLFPWWKYFGQSRPLRIFAVRDETGRLVALAPLMLGLRESGRFYPRTLAFVGSGHEGPMGQDFHLLASREAGTSAEDALWSSVFARSREWDVLRIWKLCDHPGAVATVMGIARHATNGVALRPSGTAVCGILPESFELFLRQVPSKVERNLMRNQFRKLREQFGEVEFHLCQLGCQMSAGVERVMDFNVARLGKRSTWAQPRYRGCLQEMVQGLHTAGVAHVPTLTVAGHPVAGAVVLTAGDTISVFAPGFDPAYGKHSVMHAFYACLIEHSINQGLRNLDWLSDHPYQRKMVVGERCIYHCDVFSNAAPGFERHARRLWFRALRRRGKALLVAARTREPHEDPSRGPAHADIGSP